MNLPQRSAIATTCQSLDQIIGWQGAAGAGKTYALNALKEIAEAEGYEVSGYAPSAAAAHELGESLNIETNTVARLLLESAVAEPDSEERQRRKLWLIDEAGLLSMRDARSLLTKAAASNVRVVLVGDTRQLSSVEAGNPFRSLQAGGMITAHLDQARRQQQAELRQAVQMISQGKIGAGIQVLERSGAISEIEDAQARGEQLVSDYLSLSADERRETLLLSGTNANRLALTEQIRAGMQAEGSLGKNVYTMQSLQRKDLTQVQARYVSHYAVDDVIVPIRDYRQQGLEKHQQYRVSAIDTASNLLTVETSDHQLIQIDPALCQRKAVYTTLSVEMAAGDLMKWTKNNRVAGTRNGQQFTVTSITPAGIAQIVNDQGKSRTVDLSAGAQHVDYAWVSTTYSSQGKTAGAVMALIDSTTNREAFYVATSRAKQRLQLYTASVEALQQLAEQSRANENVSDYIPLFELTTLLETTPDEPAAAESTAAEQTTTDYAEEATRDADNGSDRGQPAVDDGSSASAEADIGAGGVTAGYVEAVRRVVAGIEERLRTEERFQQVVRIGAAAQSIISGARQLALATAAADRLDGQLERKAQQRRLGSRDPVALVEATRLETPESRQMPLPLVLQPPAPNASLTQQLYLFASTLGYQPGDRLYVRALLPKQLSDELAIEHGLKFEIEENGQKRLIPNTRRGYLTVGNWSFTHLRKNREPAVYADGIATLTELNQQGRGIYFVVNPGGERDAEITAARSLFWENDDKTKAEQMAQVRTSGLSVGAIVETNKSLHCYSPLDRPLHNLDEWTTLQERVIQRMDSDAAIRNRSRLMRLPGFDHVRVQDEALVFSPVTLQHIDPVAKATVEEIDAQLPLWDVARWEPPSKEAKAKGQAASKPRQGAAVAPSMAADNPWDIRNFAQYLNGDQHSQSGWLEVQCPEHGGEGHSGNSLHINEQTGQYKCHGGCDSQAVYTAAWKLAQSRGWEPPTKRKQAIERPTGRDGTNTKSVVEASARKLTRWQRYSVSIDTPPGRKRDFQIATKAFSDGLSKQQVISLLAKNSPKAQKLYRDQGSTPAYHYVEMVAKAAQRASQHQNLRSPNQGLEL